MRSKKIIFSSSFDSILRKIIHTDGPSSIVRSHPLLHLIDENFLVLFKEKSIPIRPCCMICYVWSIKDFSFLYMLANSSKNHLYVTNNILRWTIDEDARSREKQVYERAPFQIIRRQAVISNNLADNIIVDNHRRSKEKKTQLRRYNSSLPIKMTTLFY